MPLSILTQLLSFLEWGENETQTLLQGGRRLKKVEPAGAHSIHPPLPFPLQSLTNGTALGFWSCPPWTFQVFGVAGRKSDA